MSSAVGIVVGMGFFTAATTATFITILVLNGFGWLEKKLPTYKFSRLMVRCKRNEAIEKKDLFDIVHNHNFKTSTASYELVDDGHYIQYEFTIQTKIKNNLETLAKSLIDNQLIIEFSLIPLGR
jgi:putative Mg2+ transporter-C (MgtC) family protein